MHLLNKVLMRHGMFHHIFKIVVMVVIIYSIICSLEDNYKVIRELGYGGYGLVLEVKRLTDGLQLAIKLKICM